MKLPARAIQIIDAFLQRNPELAKGTDDNRRALTMAIAQQIRFELGPGWGTKRADPGRPPSKDSFSFKGDHLYNWDWQNGTSRGRQVFAGQEGAKIDDQTFIEVTGVDRLGVGAPVHNDGHNDTHSDGPAPPPPVLDGSVLEAQLGEIRKDIGRMRVEVVELQLQVKDLLEKMLNTSYKARLFGLDVVLKPERE